VCSCFSIEQQLVINLPALRVNNPVQIRLLRVRSQPKAWKFFLGKSVCLLSNTDNVKTLTKTQMRCLLVTAYSVKFSVLANCVDSTDRFEESFLSVRDKPSVEGRTVQLVNTNCFKPRPITSLLVNPKLEEFLRATDSDRLLEFLRWQKPQVTVDKKGLVYVMNSAPIVTMARYLSPASSARFECLSTKPVSQLSMSQCSDMYVSTFQAFISENRDAICRIAASAVEASLLTGCSESLAYEIRSKQGALEI
jgi:hypothetical protein